MKALSLIFSFLCVLLVSVSFGQKNMTLPSEATGEQTTSLDQKDSGTYFKWLPYPITNAPNPFEEKTMINYSLQNSGHVLLIVYRLGGSEMDVLLSRYLRAGSYSTEFDASELPDGIYFAKLRIGNFVFTKEMIKNAGVDFDILPEN